MKCIGLCKNKLCNKNISDNKIYCKIHIKPKRNNLLSNKKSNVKYEIIKLLSYSLSHDLLDEELIDISKQKNILTDNFTICYICNNISTIRYKINYRYILSIFFIIYYLFNCSNTSI